MTSVVDLDRSTNLHDHFIHAHSGVDNVVHPHHSHIPHPCDVLNNPKEVQHISVGDGDPFSVPLSDQLPSSPSSLSTHDTDEAELETEADSLPGYDMIKMDPDSWAGNLPADQGLYSNENEHDSCGVGLICKITGEASHFIVSDARSLLCAMTHRGAVGADTRDGDGAGVMTGIPHEFFRREVERDIGSQLPDVGKYAVGNVFMNPNDATERQKHQLIFEGIASGLGLRVLGWREVPTDGYILGPSSRSKEPIIIQPVVVLKVHYGDGNKPENGPFDEKRFERQLYVLRKHATHTMFVQFLCNQVSNHT